MMKVEQMKAVILIIYHLDIYSIDLFKYSRKLMFSWIYVLSELQLHRFSLIVFSFTFNFQPCYTPGLSEPKYEVCSRIERGVPGGPRHGR